MLRNEWLAHLDGLVVFRGLLAAESADAADVNSFVLSTAVMTNFSRLLTTKLLDLQNAPFTEEAVALWNPEE